MVENRYLIDTNLIDNPGRDARIGLEISEFDDLVISIRENGILQPILVRPRGDRYEVIAGNRRLQVARKLGLHQVPALVRDASDVETVIFRFEENLKRSDINAVEEAKYIAESITALGLPVHEFAERINRSTQWVEDRLTVATMPDYLQVSLIQKSVTLGVALALVEITDEQVRKDWSYHAATHGMTVLAAENALREWQKLDKRRQEAPEGADIPPPPKEPPVAYVHCVRCGVARPMQQTHFVRVCNPLCPTEESAPSVC